MPAVYEHGTEGRLLLHRDGVPRGAEPLRGDRATGRWRPSARPASPSSCASSSKRRTASKRRSTAGTLRSLLHGDLKPRNIRVLDGDRIKVLDFGIAKALSLSRKVTRNDFGSIAYLSPERLESGEIDAHADFWAVGVLLYEMVSGVQPFRAPDTRRLEQRIRSLQPRGAARARRVPPGLQAIVAKLLAGDAGGSLPRRRRRFARISSASRPVRTTQAQREGWPARRTTKPRTRRTRPPSTRRGGGDAPDAPSAGGPADADRALDAGDHRSRPVQPQPVETAAPVPGGDFLRTALLLLALVDRRQRAVGGFAARGASRPAVPTRELDGVGQLWDQYDALNARGSLRHRRRRSGACADEADGTLAERVIGNYRTPLPDGQRSAVEDGARGAGARGDARTRTTVNSRARCATATATCTGSTAKRARRASRRPRRSTSSPTPWPRFARPPSCGRTGPIRFSA